MKIVLGVPAGQPTVVAEPPDQLPHKLGDNKEGKETAKKDTNQTSDDIERKRRVNKYGCDLMP